MNIGPLIVLLNKDNRNSRLNPSRIASGDSPKEYGTKYMKITQTFIETVLALL